MRNPAPVDHGVVKSTSKEIDVDCALGRHGDVCPSADLVQGKYVQWVVPATPCKVGSHSQASLKPLIPMSSASSPWCNAIVLTQS